MRRVVLFILLAMLAAVLPLWPYSRNWSFGPAIAMAFLLAVNLLDPVFEYCEGRWSGALPEHGRVPADVAVTPNPGAGHAESVEAPEIDPARSG
jgi:hypothetical protein